MEEKVSDQEDKELFDIVKKILIMNAESYDPSNPTKNQKQRHDLILDQIKLIK